MRQNGFTLVELVIVFSIMALLAVGGLASFSAFTQRQVLASAAADLKSLLNVARTNTLSQYNAACADTKQFGGYLVVVCCRAGNASNPINETPALYCPNVGCSGSNDYELYESCVNSDGSTDNQLIQGKTLPQGVVISRQTTARMFQFTPVSGAVSYGTQGTSISSGAVVFYLNANKSVTQSTSVSSVGAIQ